MTLPGGQRKGGENTGPGPPIRSEKQGTHPFARVQKEGREWGILPGVHVKLKHLKTPSYFLET